MPVLRFKDVVSALNSGLAVSLTPGNAQAMLRGGVGFTEPRGVITALEITKPLLEAAGSCQMTVWADTSGETKLLVCEALRDGKSLMSANKIGAGKDIKPIILGAIIAARDAFQGGIEGGSECAAIMAEQA